MATRRPFWKWPHWKSLGFCLWPPSTCIWNLKLKFQSKLDLCSGNHVVYRQTDRRTDKVNPVYPHSNFVGRGYNYHITTMAVVKLLAVQSGRGLKVRAVAQRTMSTLKLWPLCWLTLRYAANHNDTMRIMIDSPEKFIWQPCRLTYPSPHMELYWDRLNRFIVSFISPYTCKWYLV